MVDEKASIFKVRHLYGKEDSKLVLEIRFRIEPVTASVLKA